MNIPTFLQENIDITEFSGYKTRARARFFFEVKNLQDVEKLHEIFLFASENSLPFLILGGGKNCLFAFDTYHGIFIKNSMNAWKYDSHTQILTTDSDAEIWKIAETLENDFQTSIWHRFIGLPGSIGGAIYGNAGCFGLETESNFLSAEVLDLATGEILPFSKEEMEFSYRNSWIKKMRNERHFFIISARFDLSKVVEKYASDADVRLFRETKQPKGNTCGSFFQNPNKEQSAGFLIEAVGLRGFHLGTASFSSVHANFLMSETGGKWQDLIELIQFVQMQVKKKYAIDLIPEVQIVSGNSEKMLDARHDRSELSSR